MLRAKGRGLVITDGSGREVKASSVSRDGGRVRLEGRLGEGYREHRARVAERTGGDIPGALSPVAEAAVRTHREAEAVRPLRTTLEGAAERLGRAESTTRLHEALGPQVGAARTAFQRGLGAACTDPRVAERSFLARSGERGPQAAAGELRAYPERFGALREVQMRTWGMLAQRSQDEARQAARGAAGAGEEYVRGHQALASARAADPTELAMARVVHGRAQAALERRPTVRALERRLEGLGKGLPPADRAALRSGPLRGTRTASAPGGPGGAGAGGPGCVEGGRDGARSGGRGRTWSRPVSDLERCGRE